MWPLFGKGLGKGLQKSFCFPDSDSGFGVWHGAPSHNDLFDAWKRHLHLSGKNCCLGSLGKVLSLNNDL